MKKDNSLLLVILSILIILFFITVCRTKTTRTPLPDNKISATDNNNMLLGNPTNAMHSVGDPDNYLIDHIYYMESYNSTNATPNWVSWHIGASDLGNVKRRDDFRKDNNLPGRWYAVTADDYKNSGFDKGHNCPSGDRTASQEANSATFFMDNILPQAPRNNEQTWEHLESYCRDKVKKGNEAYIVMGCYGAGGTGSKGYKTTIGNGKIRVPSRIWKVAVILAEGNNDLQRVNTKTTVIAIDTPNDNSISSNWMTYTTTIDEIEKKCGCNLLSALPADVQNEIESKRFVNGN